MKTEGTITKCPACNHHSLELVVAHPVIEKTCHLCKHKSSERLPPLNKKVVYLDQFAISNLTKTESRHPDAPYWHNLALTILKTVLYQGAIFPISGMHAQETILDNRRDRILEFQDSISGGSNFIENGEINIKQVTDIIKSLIFKTDVYHDFSVKNVLTSDPNVWLHKVDRNAFINTDSFVDGMKGIRIDSERDLLTVYERRRDEGKSFDEIQYEEAKVFGHAHIKQWMAATSAAINGNEDAYRKSGSVALIHAIQKTFMDYNGLDQTLALEKTFGFLNSDYVLRIPNNIFHATLHAVFAERIAGGKKYFRMNSLNDMSFVSMYTPYCDAAFIDREMHSLVLDDRVQHILGLFGIKTKYFSMKQKEGFLAYLNNVADQIPEVQKVYAEALYPSIRRLK